MNDAHGVHLLDLLPVVFAREHAPPQRLQLNDYVRQLHASLLLQVLQQIHHKKHLAPPKAVQILGQLQVLDHHFAGELVVHEALGYDVRAQDLVALAELLEGDAVGEALAADADALEDAVASELVEHQWRVYLAGL